MQFIGAGRTDDTYSDAGDNETSFDSGSSSNSGAPIQNSPSDDDIPF